MILIFGELIASFKEITLCISKCFMNKPWHKFRRNTSKKGILMGWWLRRCSSIWPRTI